MPDCIFCQIINAEAPGNFVHTDEDVVAINDVNPKAPIHILVMPRQHYSSLAETGTDETYLLGQMLWVAKMLADENRLTTRGYKIILNVGPDGGQTVPHLHLHLLGGKTMKDLSVE